MRSTRMGVFVCTLLLALPSGAQTLTSPGVATLQQSLTSMAGSTSVSDVTLNGTANRIAGSGNDTGAITLEALATGQSSLKFDSSAGTSTEVRSISSAGLGTGSWSGPDGVSHPMAAHNVMTDSSWFFPALTIAKLLGSQATSVSLVAEETKDGVSVTHLTTSQQLANVPADSVSLMQHLSQMDLYLDGTTLLPVALSFSVHPDNNMLLDIPVEIRFSDYRAVNGVQVAHHIQKYVDNSLFLDIQIQTATLNSGLAPSALTIQ
jgi:hypothetical protein